MGDFLFLFYFCCFFVVAFSAYQCIRARKIRKKYMVIMLIGIAYISFYSYESIPIETTPCNHIAVSDVEGLSEKEIVHKMLVQEFDHYKSERLFAKNKIFDYKINRIDGPIKGVDATGKIYYGVSYSVKAINSKWIAGNGEEKGFWVKNKFGYFDFMKEDNQYILKYVGGL